MGPASCLDAFSSKKLLIFLDPVSRHQQLFVWISQFPGKTVFSGTQFKVVTDNSFICAFENTTINLNRNGVSLTSDKKRLLVQWGWREKSRLDAIHKPLGCLAFVFADLLNCFGSMRFAMVFSIPENNNSDYMLRRSL